MFRECFCLCCVAGMPVAILWARPRARGDRTWVGGIESGVWVRDVMMRLFRVMIVMDDHTLVVGVMVMVVV